jgi:hypothetical protein
MSGGNGGFNPFFEHETLSNDREQARIVMIGLAIAAIVSVILIVATVLGKTTP